MKTIKEVSAQFEKTQTSYPRQDVPGLRTFFNIIRSSHQKWDNLEKEKYTKENISCRKLLVWTFPIGNFDHKNWKFQHQAYLMNLNVKLKSHQQHWQAFLQQPNSFSYFVPLVLNTSWRTLRWQTALGQNSKSSPFNSRLNIQGDQ